jgi:hypothetical protein
LGEKALDRSPAIKKSYPPTTAAALTETSRRTGADLIGRFSACTPVISPLKYRSERRKDQLQAVARLLVIAAVMYADHTGDSLQRWNEFLLPVFFVPVWDFPTAILKTPMQRALPP